MKKIIIVCTALVLLFFHSCKKSTNPQGLTSATDSSIIKSVNQWINEFALLPSSSGSKSTIDSSKDRIDWKSVEQIKLSEEGSIVIADFKETTNRIKKLFFIQNNTGKTLLGSIIVLSPQGTYGKSEINQYIKDIYEGNENPYNGYFTILTLGNKFLQENVYKKGSLYSITLLKRKIKEGAEASPIREQIGCIDWYLETYINGDLVDEQYLYTTCAGGDVPCAPYRKTERSQVAFKTACGGGGGSDDPILEYIRHKLCRSTFDGFQDVTNDKSSYSLNILDFKFVSGNQVNAFDALVNVQNFIRKKSMNTIQPTAMPGFMPPGLSYLTPIQLYEEIPILNDLIKSGDIKYDDDPFNDSGLYSYSPYAYSVIASLAADWAATNTYALAPDPALNPLAATTFRAQFQGILAAFLPGSRVRAETDTKIATKFAIYDPSGLCR